MLRTPIAPIVALLALAAATDLAAVPIRIEVTTNFYPPNPCATSSLGNFENYTLEGIFGVSYLLAGEISPTFPGLTEIPSVAGIACGASAQIEIGFDFDAGAEAMIYLTFGGFLTPSSGPPEFPMFAFDADSVPQEKPDSAPPILIAEFDGGHMIRPGPPSLPLFVFASPGHLIGTLTVRVVPEPGVAMLLGLALGIAGAMTRIRRLR